MGNEAVSTTNPNNPTHAMTDQYDGPTIDKSVEYLILKVLLQVNLIGQKNTNPLLDTRVYTADIHDRDTINITANTSANSIFQNCDTDGNVTLLFKYILDHKSSEKDVRKSKVCITYKNQDPERKKTTIGWQLLIKWAGVILTWQSLSYTKESFPDQFTEYFCGNGII